MLPAVDLTATGVIVNKQFLNVTYSPFKEQHFYMYKYTVCEKVLVIVCSDVLLICDFFLHEIK